ncbi:MAG: alkaline phosphatase PhoX [Rhodothermales bacterium]
MSLSRRHFLRNSAAFAIGFTGLQTYLGCASEPRTGFGPLVSDPNGIMDLPEGFSYRIISRAGERMDDGLIVPAVQDGMAAFPGPDGTTILVCNHEVNVDAPASHGAFGSDAELPMGMRPEQLYDAGANGRPCLGGTSTLVYHTGEQRLVSRHLSLAGTLRNCAGGPTPWGSWITCEETVLRQGDEAAKDHGFNFEVPARAVGGLADPVPLTAMGRFNHEAVAVHPASGIVYQTEDRGDGLIYRFLPNQPERLHQGGRLQVLAVQGRPSLDTRNWQENIVAPGEMLSVEWLDIDDVLSPEDDLRHRGFEDGAARFARGEGMWWGNGSVYFACTNGGRAQTGQVWRYVPAENEGQPGATGELELFIEPNDSELLEHCDNVTVTPWGDLILCEDGSGEQYLVGVTPEGELYRFGRNAASDSELAGATFSPDGSTLFFNIQGDGLTLAVTGPWQT